jgi:hypothetical protein
MVFMLLSEPASLTAKGGGDILGVSGEDIVGVVGKEEKKKSGERDEKRELGVRMKMKTEIIIVREV